MKRITVIFTISLFACAVAHAQTDGINAILRSVEANNKELQANAQLIAAQKLEAKTGNNLPDPTLSYAHLWGAGNETISELVVSQSFDFPTLYADRNKLNRIRISAFDSQAEAFRRDILLRAKEICLDIIMFRQQKAILDERLRNAQSLAAIYAERLQRGDANIIETNKINLELLNVKTEAGMNEAALRNKWQELYAINGHTALEFDATDYPLVTLPADYEQLKSEVLAADHTLTALQRENEAANKQVSISKAQWLPKLELGYRRNTETGMPFNGVVVGFSIPLFENRNKVKMAKAQSLSLSYQKENTAITLESELAQLYREAQTLQSSMHEYEQTFAAQSDLDILKQALAGGQISVIEYFAEVSLVYQSKQNYLLLRNQFQKVMARIFRNTL